MVNSEPRLNDLENPLVSILIYDYYPQFLRECLERIFNQTALCNIEVIFLNDGARDGSWKIAQEYVRKYPKVMVVSHHRVVYGPEMCAWRCQRLSLGKYFITLAGDQAFLPEYVRDCVRHMEKDPYAQFSSVKRLVDVQMPPISMTGAPLVSILCYNYNYGRFLRRALASAFEQTYQNIEVCFSDNCSTDNSWEIACEFGEKYPERMYLTRNRMNMGPDANFANCFRTLSGKYFVSFCSDDVLEPQFVERCVRALETNPNAGLALVNRAIIDEEGRRTEEPPFYNCSCVVPGHEQAAVYMMAGVNPSVSQIMYRRDVVDRRTGAGGLVGRYYGTRIFDFNISLDFDIAYIKDALLLHRIHGGSDTSSVDSTLLPVLGVYVLNHQFADSAAVRGITKVTERLGPSLDKLGRLSIRYSVRSLFNKNDRLAQQYFNLAVALNPDLESDPVWNQLQEYWRADAKGRKAILKELGGSSNLAARSISYDPPPGSRPLE